MLATTARVGVSVHRSDMPPRPLNAAGSTMALRGAPRLRRTKALTLLAAIVVLTAAHFLVSAGTHPQHVVHVLFQGLYLLPVVGGAVWFGLRGGLTASFGVGAAYSLHLLGSWRDSPIEETNQVAMLVVFLFVGVVAGTLVDRQEAERRRGREIEERLQREAIIQAIAGLSAALGFRDEYTREHSDRVAELAVRIGRARGLSENRLEVLRLAALVHDVGKIGIRDDILLKSEELTSAERAVVERHPGLAAEMLAPIRGASDIAAIVLCHHESPDGTGYPRGISGDQIPLEASVLRVADVFSALTDRRSYKPAMDRESALVWMTPLSGTKFEAGSILALQEVSGASGASHDPA